MKLKLTNSQLFALYGACYNHLDQDIPQDMELKLLHVLLTKLVQRINNMLFIKKKKYSLTLKPEEALAFWLSFNDHEYEITNQLGNLLTMICNQIHQRYEMSNALCLKNYSPSF